MDQKFEELVDLRRLKELLQAFFEISEISSAVVDPVGNVLRTSDGEIVGAGWRRICLDFHRANPISAARCRLSDTAICQVTAPHTHHLCPHGLVDAARPVVINGTHMASLFTGQFFLEPPNPERFRRQAAEFGFDEAAYMAALGEVPVFTEESVQKTLTFLDSLAKTIAEMGMAQKRLIDLNRELAAGLAEAQQVAQLGSWVEELGRLSWSDEMLSIFGLSRIDFGGTRQSFLHLIHPEDREAVGRAYSDSLADGGRYDAEYRIVRPDGSIRWVHSRCEHVRDGQGKVSRSIGTAMDITDRKEAQRKSEEARKVAEEASRAKSLFFAAASHDLRQPFQAMRLFFDVLDQSAQSNQRPAMDRLDQAMRSAEELLNDLLDVARLQNGAISVRSTAVDLGQLVRDLQEELGPVASQKGLLVRVYAPALLVHTDPLILRRILFNIAANALKYTESGGVLIGVRRRQKEIFVEVWDSGIGIAEGHADWIFEEFYQIDNVARDRSQGIGLGLAIVNRLCRLVDCQVSFRSRPGRGTVFRVTIPLRPTLSA